MSQSEAVLVSQFLAGNNLGSFVQRVIDEVSRASDDDVDAIRRAMISAMRHFEPLRLWFKEDTFTFDLTVDQQAYSQYEGGTDGWPSDFVSPTNMYLLVSGTRYLPLQQVDQNDMRWATPTSTVTGLPSVWSWYNDQIWFTPIPSEAGTIRCDYIAEPGIPAYYYDGTSWMFLGPSGAPLTNNWSSPWFTKGEELLRARTKWDLYYNYYDDVENAIKQGGSDGHGGAVGIAYDNIMKRHNAKKLNVRRSVTAV